MTFTCNTSIVTALDESPANEMVDLTSAFGGEDFQGARCEQPVKAGNSNKAGSQPQWDNPNRNAAVEFKHGTAT